MIILIDNENYMIRLCEKDPDIYGFSPSYPNWKQIVKFLSDTGHMVVLSGEEQEQWLDDNNIYYVHVEHKAKESFETFKKRMNRLIEENREYIDNSLSFGRLHFALTVDGQKGSVDTPNIVEVWRLNEDGKYHFALSLPTDNNGMETALKVEEIASKLAEHLGFEHDDDTERAVFKEMVLDILFGKDFNIYTADTLVEVYGKLMLIAECCVAGIYSAQDLYEDAKESSVANHYEELKDDSVLKGLHRVEDEEEDEEEIRDNPQHINQCHDCSYECPCDADPDNCPLDNDEKDFHMSVEIEEDEDGKVSCKINGKEVSEDELKAMIEDSINELIKVLSE